MENPDSTSTSSGAASLVLKPNVILPGLSVTLQLSVTYGDATGYSRIWIRGDVPPKGGYLTLSPPTGTQWETTFTFEQEAWYDEVEQTPLRYSYDMRLSAGWVAGAVGECEPSDEWTSLAAGLTTPTAYFTTDTLVAGSIVVRAVAEDTLGARNCDFGFVAVTAPAALESDPTTFLSEQLSTTLEDLSLGGEGGVQKMALVGSILLDVISATVGTGRRMEIETGATGTTGTAGTAEEGSGAVDDESEKQQALVTSLVGAVDENMPASLASGGDKAAYAGALSSIAG